MDRQQASTATTWPPNFRMTVRLQWSVATTTDPCNLTLGCTNTTELTSNADMIGGRLHEGSGHYSVVTISILSILFGITILANILGNVLVIFAIIFERDLKRPQYYLILSLAVADLMVGLSVMPLAAMYEVLGQRWTLGESICDLWISLDVLCCTASILHLVAIAIDRYWSITDVVYSQKRTPCRIGVMILVIWVLSLVVSVAPILGWKDDKFKMRIAEQKCLISQDLGYQIFSTSAAFYAPLIMIIVLYWKIYKAAQKRIRRTRHSNSAKKLMLAIRCTAGELTPDPESTLQPSAGDSPEDTPRRLSVNCNGVMSASSSFGDGTPKSDSDAIRVNLNKRRIMRKKLTLESKRERKAMTTLAIVTGTFVLCWLPFFVLALLRPICRECKWSSVLDSVTLWLGYANSLMNPIIYTIFSPDFRSAFRKLLSQSCHGRSR